MPPSPTIFRATLLRGSALLLLALCAAAPLRARAQVLSKIDPEEAARLSPGKAPEKSQTKELQATVSEVRESERFRTIRESMAPEKRGESEFRIRALEGFIDYDEEEKVLYGPERTRVEYGDFALEADKLIFDNRLQEVQAEGNVILRSSRTDLEKDEIRADSMRYNFRDGEGVAFNVQGQHPPVYFKSEASRNPKLKGLPDFQQVSSEESIFRDAQVTGCDFKVPHYYLRAREVILFMQDRIFFRGATFYVLGAPVMYLPFYSRSLRESSPWFVQLGYGSRTGARIRVGYQYEHQTKEPTFEDDEKYEIRSFGQAQTFVDYLSKRGFGAGFNYKYEFDYDRHAGKFAAYGIDDGERKVATNVTDPGDDSTDNENERSQILWQHRSSLTKRLTLTTDIDWFSDPEVFYDILDNFVDSEFDRERQIERKASGALTYLREAWVARLLVDVRDRAGIDRYNDFSDPRDNNRDFDFDPRTDIDNTNADSLGHERWGRVSEKAPQFNFATRYLPVRNWPLFLTTEFAAYNNLDRGINLVDDADDARVRGGEFYTQGLWQHKFSERYTLLAKLGVGAGFASRSNDDLGIRDGVLDPLDGIVLDHGSDDTFIVGKDKYNFDDIDSFYAWADSELRFNARFSDALSGFLAWRFRETTNDFVGDWHAQIGDRMARQDIYNYRLREHWLTGNLTYALLYPRLVAFANAGLNLESQSSLYPGEETYFWNLGSSWMSINETIKAAATFGATGRQILHPSDGADGQQDYYSFQSSLSYEPIHQRWYVRTRYSYRFVSGQQVERSGDDKRTFFSDEDTRSRFALIYGRELGPKWNTEIKAEWDQEINGLREVSWLLQRDMHDALAILRVRSKQDVSKSNSRNDNEQSFDVSLGMKFKLPGQELGFGPRDIKTVKQRERQPVTAQ